MTGAVQSLPLHTATGLGRADLTLLFEPQGPWFWPHRGMMPGQGSPGTLPCTVAATGRAAQNTAAWQTHVLASGPGRPGSLGTSVGLSSWDLLSVERGPERLAVQGQLGGSRWEGFVSEVAGLALSLEAEGLSPW